MKPILFNTEMVQKILSGEKTVTRRVVKPYPKGACAIMDSDNETHTFDLLCRNGKKLTNWTIKAPFWFGDILYVRETFFTHKGQYYYKADGKHTALDTIIGGSFFKWRPSIHMPREAARIFLRVTDVRVEQLYDMRMGDMKDEGMIPSNVSGGSWQQWQRDYAQPAWDSTIKKADLDRYGWDANPWVWVIKFKRISKEEV